MADESVYSPRAYLVELRGDDTTAYLLDTLRRLEAARARIDELDHALATAVQDKERAERELVACRGRLLELERDAKHGAANWLRDRAHELDVEGHTLCGVVLRGAASDYEAEDP